MNTNFGITSTAPTGSATITLIDTFVALAGNPLAAAGVSRIEVSGRNSHVGALQLFESIDGTTYRQVGGDVPVSPSATDDVSGPYDFLVDPYKFVSLKWVNGGTTQTTWEWQGTLISKRVKGD